MTAPKLGAARIVTSSGGTYQPDPAGEYAAIIGVHDAECELVDLCAWFPDAPGRWWLRFSDECFFLGARALAVAAYFHDPIELHATPEAWALAGGRGVCLLRWDIDARDWIEGVKRIDAHPAVAARLRAIFRAWEPATGRSRRAA